MVSSGTSPTRNIYLLRIFSGLKVQLQSLLRVGYFLYPYASRLQTGEVFAILWLPLSSQSWWMLTEREKQIASKRILMDSSTTVNTPLNVREAFSAFKNPMYWCGSLPIARNLRTKSYSQGMGCRKPRLWVQQPGHIFISTADVPLSVPLASVNNFLPQIVTSLGYSTVKTNLLTVAPNVVGTVAWVLLTFSSDHFRERSGHMYSILLFFWLC
jgi:hypothetical protein